MRKNKLRYDKNAANMNAKKQDRLSILNAWEDAGLAERSLDNDNHSQEQPHERSEAEHEEWEGDEEYEEWLKNSKRERFLVMRIESRSRA